MLGNRKKAGLSRRIVAYYLVFCLVSIVWLGVSTTLLMRNGERLRSETACLSILGQATTAVELAHLRGDEDDVQRLIERLQQQHSLIQCAVVSLDGEYLGHSSRELRGKKSREVIGERIQFGDIQAVRFEDRNEQEFREYRAPLKSHGKQFGSLRMTVAEPKGSTSALSMAQRTPIILVTLLSLLLMGGFVLYRMVRPMASIEAQLRQAALAPSINEACLQPVHSRSHPAAILGWNRLIEKLRNPTENGNLDERLNEAVQARREQQGSNLLDSFPEGFAATDSEGCITYVNRALSALLANDAENHQPVGSTMLDYLGIDSAAESGEDSQQASLVDPASLGRSTISELHKSFGNGQRVLRVARHPVGTVEQASRAKHIWSVRDVTQQKLAEQMRDDFLDSATHELRTPLANIKAYAEALTISEAMEVEQQKEFCNTISSEATRLARLIDDLLSISSLEVGSLTIAKQRTELDRLLDDIVGKVAPLMKEKDLDFQTTVPDKVPQLKLDKDKFSVALVNLLGNAAKYTPQGGRVALDVQVKDNQLVVDVEDSGIGISPDDQSRLFEKFFRSANLQVRSESGTGLGLSLANEIIQLHGGEITIDSELGKGSTFTITVPLT